MVFFRECIGFTKRRSLSGPPQARRVQNSRAQRLRPKRQTSTEPIGGPEINFLIDNFCVFRTASV
jgi:hypothetical protein